MNFQINTPLCRAIKKYLDKDMSRMHMPGHKGQNIYDISNLFSYDLTEVDGLDNLLDSKGAIKKTENLYRDIYGSELTVISAQGSTLGVQMMITAALMATENQETQKTEKRTTKKKIIIDRNSHISAVNTMALLDIEPVWIFHDKNINNQDINQDKKIFLPGIISAENIEDKIINNPDAEIVYITSPNYFGEMMDLKSIFEVCKKHDKFLLVDNAHGAHLKFAPGKKLHPVDCGCSCCSDSLHKTLPVLTGGALVHVLDKRLVPYIKKAQRIYSSTSPSYLIMLSIDLLINYVNKNLREDFLVLEKQIQELREFVKAQSFQLLEHKNVDNFKISIGPGRINCSTDQIAQIFRKFRIEPEYTSKDWVLLMFSPQNQDKDFQRIKDALGYMVKVFNKLDNKKLKMQDFKTHSFEIQKALSLKQAMFCASKRVKTKDSMGKISASSITTYPPGVPIVMPGEVLSKELINWLISDNIDYIDIVDA